MRDEQRGYAAGIGWVALTVVALVSMGQPPAGSASSKDVMTFFTDHTTGVVIGSTSSAVGALLMGTFLVSLTRRFTDEWPAQLARLTGAVVVAAGLFGGVLQAWLAHSASRIGVDGVGIAWTIVYPVFYLLPPLALSWVFGNAAFALRGAGVPGWVPATAGILFVLSFVLGVAEVASEATWVSNVAFIGLPLTLLWVLATAIVMWRRPSADIGLVDSRTAVAR